MPEKSSTQFQIEEALSRIFSFGIGILWATFYSLVLSVIGYGVGTIYAPYNGTISSDACDQIFLYITLLIAWLFTKRPDHAMDVYEKLTESIHDIMLTFLNWSKKLPEKSKKTKKIYDPEELFCIDEFYSVYIYVITNISTHENTYKRAPEPKIDEASSKNARKIIDAFTKFKIAQRLAVPVALHSMCIIFTFIFHGVAVPIILQSHDMSVEGTIFANAFMAFFTTGCLLVAIQFERPYDKVISQSFGSQIKELHYFFNNIKKVISAKESFIEKNYANIHEQPFKCIRYKSIFIDSFGIGEIEPSTVLYDPPKVLESDFEGACNTELKRNGQETAFGHGKFV